MRIVFIVVLLVISQITYAQKFQDIVEYNNEFYLITPSPSEFIYFDTLSEINFNDWMNFSASYEFRNDSLFFKEYLRLKPNNPYYDILQLNLKSGDYVNVCEKFELVKISNFNEDFEKQIRFSPITVYGYNRKGISVKTKCSYDLVNNDTTEKKEIVWGQLIIEQCYEDFLSFTSIHIKDSNGITITNENFHANFSQKTFSLKEGVYTVELKSENSTLVIPRLIIRENKKEYIQCYGKHDGYSYNNDKPLELNNKNLVYTAVKIEFLYGNNTLHQNSPTEINNFGWGLTAQNFVSLGSRRMIDAFIDLGGNFNLAFHNTDTVTINNSLIRLQNYSHLNLRLATGFRFNFSKIKNKYPTRPFLELGAGYQLPIVFRHLYRGISAKFSDRWIHNFQDVYVYSRIGISNTLSIQASYRLFDVVLKNKPQLPTWQFGLIFEIEN
jgi:hypothetical protein